MLSETRPFLWSNKSVFEETYSVKKYPSCFEKHLEIPFSPEIRVGSLEVFERPSHAASKREFVMQLQDLLHPLKKRPRLNSGTPDVEPLEDPHQDPLRSTIHKPLGDLRHLSLDPRLVHSEEGGRFRDTRQELLNRINELQWRTGKGIETHHEVVRGSSL